MQPLGGGGKSHMRPLAYALVTMMMMMMMKRTVSMLMRLNDGRGPCVGHPGLAYCRRFRSGLVDVIDDRAVAFDLVYPTSCVVSHHHRPAHYNSSVESNRNVESKRQSVESKMGKWGVQLLAYLQFYILKWWLTHGGDFHFQFCPFIFTDLRHDTSVLLTYFCSLWWAF